MAFAALAQTSMHAGLTLSPSLTDKRLLERAAHSSSLSSFSPRQSLPTSAFGESVFS